MILRLSSCGLLAATLIWLAPPASTATLVRYDPSGDVVSYEGQHPDVTTAAPAQTNGDIVGTRIVHSRRAVRVLVRYRDLRRIGGSFALAEIRTPNTRFYVELVAGRRRYGGRTRFADASDRVLHCKGLTHAIDYGKNLERIAVPDTCVGRPPWVRVGINDATSVDGFRTVYGDDAGTGDPIGTELPVLSRRLWVGPAVFRQ